MSTEAVKHKFRHVPLVPAELRFRQAPLGAATASSLAALRAHCEAMDLEATLNDWTPEQRHLVFPNSAGFITRYGAFLELVWQPLLRKAALPYRKPHAMRHSYATWLLEAGADIRWVRDQMGTPRSERRRAPTGIWCASTTSETWTRSTRHSGRRWCLTTTAEHRSLSTLGVPPRPTASHRLLVSR